MTKQEKHKAYKQCLIDIESKTCPFCCASFMSNNFMLIKDDPKKLFPELYELRTNKISSLWFKNSEERIDALKKCIELTKD